MLIDRPSRQSSSCPLRARSMLMATVLGMWVGLALPRSANAASVALSLSDVAKPFSSTGSGPVMGVGIGTKPGHLPSMPLLETVVLVRPVVAPISPGGLQLLDPAIAADDADTGFFADLGRWSRILLAEYQTFLPLIVMFAMIGAIGLAYYVRRSVLGILGGVLPGVGRVPKRTLTDRSAHLARSAMRPERGGHERGGRAR